MQKIRGSRAAAGDARRKERARRGEAQCKGRSRQHLDWGILWAVRRKLEEAQYKSSGAVGRRLIGVGVLGLGGGWVRGLCFKFGSVWACDL